MRRRDRNRPKGEWVYFFLCALAGRIKIGYTADILSRMYTYNTECPVRLTFLGAIPGDRNDEKVWHGRFRVQKHHGEWFTVTRELVDAIATAPGFIRDPLESYRQGDGPTHGKQHVWPKAPPEIEAARVAFVAKMEASVAHLREESPRHRRN